MNWPYYRDGFIFVYYTEHQAHTTTGPFDPSFNNNPNVTQTNTEGYGYDIAITKFSPDGTSLLYSTYLGGSGSEAPHSLVVNSQNQLIVMGSSSSPDYPTQNAFDATHNGGPSLNLYGLPTEPDHSNGTDIIVTIFTEDGNKYRYGFEVDQEKVHREWLYQKKEKEVVLFEREGQKITELNESSFHEGKIIKKGIKMFTEKTLIVSILDQLSSEVSTKIVSNITNKIIITPTFIDRTGYLFNRVINQFEKDKDFKNWTLKLLKEID